MSKYLEGDLNYILSTLDPLSLVGKKTLIIGDVGKGKTRLSAEIIMGLVERGFGNDITVIDLAPDAGWIGVRISRYISGIRGLRYFSPRQIYAPRLHARNRRELKRYIFSNYKESLRLFEEFLDNPTDILVVNDLSIFLHYGEIDIIIDTLDMVHTFIGNSYYGESLRDRFGLGLDEIERRKVDEIIMYMDIVVKLV